jgi:hypothetical protein
MKTLTKRLLLICIGLITFLSSCDPPQPWIISYKSRIPENPAFARFSYYAGYYGAQFTDSAHRYEVGDDVRKYSSIKFTSPIEQD